MIEEAIKTIVRQEMKEAIQEVKDQYKKETAFLHRRDNSYQPWTDTEDQYLEKGFKEAMVSLAKKHGRGTGAIRDRLRKKLGVFIQFNIED